QGHYRRSFELYAESLATRRETAGQRSVAGSLIGFAELACAVGEFKRAARLAAVIARLFEQSGAPPWPPNLGEYEHAMQAARAALGTAAFEGAWADGCALPLDDAVCEALAIRASIQSAAVSARRGESNHPARRGVTSGERR